MKWKWLVGAVVCLVPCFSSATARHYYIAAEDVSWNFAPSGRDLIDSRPIPAPWSAQTVWPKSRFVEYTDATFSQKKEQPEWLGILGPIIRAEVGDEVIVEFFNRGRVPHSIHPHGLHYDKENEGAFYLPVTKGASVAPGAKFTYYWLADPSSGPGQGQLSSIVWWYHGHTDESRETNAGLEGPIVVTAKGKAKPDGSPKGVDQEFVASFMIYDELGGKPSGQFHAINGYVFGNLPGMVMKQGETVRWYMMGMGSEKDLHSPHWHGKTVTDGTRHIDVVELMPGSTISVDMVADNPGTWLLHCHVADHMEGGMMATFTIYQQTARSCPLKVTDGSFWSSDKFSVEVQNSSGKKVRTFSLQSEYLLSPQDLHRPFTDAAWSSAESLPAGEKRAMEKKAYAADKNKQIAAWVLFPRTVEYEDGSSWKPQQEGECFQVFWRDPDHPDMKVLPPRQMDMNED